MEHSSASKVSQIPDIYTSISTKQLTPQTSYLGDALIHASFPLLLFSSDMLAPIELLGPVANWFFLRYVSGDRQTERSQEERYSAEAPEKKAEFDDYRATKNSFWPTLQELKNEWTWYVVGAGAAGAAVEYGLEALLH